ncbi:dynein heavy chain axonemal [Chrysochromulina tobinii]|uniref:Dynein heavy chain axonemal n=1 Tax=Chrysochromulina tobinii TaxID=1460289 RepID=A0A0M0K9D2_9EUKA|nr:dynein heavy chain axonemal [Chrysochromulina tobinii]|eukprot:KOO35419.1 dynein heavy chain axonemal [Chrysochromulina sp. CCMP291]
MFLDLYEEVPLAALNYLTAECNYGGRVTDDKDRRTLTTAVRNIYCAGILQDGFFLNASGSYRVPIDELQSHEATVDYVRQWPLMPSPDVFGFNDNADITKDLKEVAQTLTTVLITQSAGGGGAGAKSFDEIMMEMSKDILAKLPPNFDMEVAMKRYPVRYDECKNTVICQELAKFNKLLDRVRGSLQTLQKAVKGLVVMDAALEGLSKNMLNNQTPLLWMKVSYPSLKPLSSYIAELLERLDFFQHWLDDGPPTVFQMPKFFFVQAFMTGVMQNFANVPAAAGRPASADKECQYTETFHMYMTTRMINPHFSPELCAQVAVINFAVTMAGLEQQLLRRVVMAEQLELEEQRLRLVEEVPTNLKTLSPRTYTTSSAVGFLPSLTPLFAIGLLHTSIKVTNEAPAGIRAGLNGTLLCFISVRG